MITTLFIKLKTGSTKCVLDQYTEMQTTISSNSASNSRDEMPAQTQTARYSSLLARLVWENYSETDTDICTDKLRSGRAELDV